MVRKTLYIAGALLFFTSAYGADASIDEDITPSLKPTTLTVIQNITIQENGATSPSSEEPAEACQAFVLTKDEVLEYLHQAGEVDAHDYWHMLDWSPCHASGSVLFSDGLSGVWGIQQSRAGSLRLSDGRVIYLYCPMCRAKAFSQED